MVASASDSVRTVGNLDALREVKRAEEKVRTMRADAEEEAQATIREAKAEAREILDEKVEAAQAEAETIIQEAEASAKAEAEEILEDAAREADQLRDVPEEQIEAAVAVVVDRFRSEIGGA